MNNEQKMDALRDEIKNAVIERCQQHDDHDEPKPLGGLYAYAKVWVKGKNEPLVFYHGRRAIVDQAVARIKNKTQVVTGCTADPNTL